jgi:hypothetical protein
MTEQSSQPLKQRGTTPWRSSPVVPLCPNAASPEIFLLLNILVYGVIFVEEQPRRHPNTPQIWIPRTTTAKILQLQPIFGYIILL